MKDMCAKCKKRDTCKKLCKKAEEYVNSDHVSQQECIGAFFNGKDISEVATWDDVNLNNSTVLKTTILKLYFDDGKSVMDIYRMLPCSWQYVSEVIIKYKKKSQVKK